MPPPAGSTASAKKPGEYLVVARRYRPQSFQELVAQDQVTQALTTAIRTNRIGHAYLFTGARGVGKTSTARIFAKALNCVEGPTPTPCNRCDICLSITSGEDVDVLEIDGASNRGIDEIRQLRSNVNIRPSRAHFKIYIIDEVHMLTLAAFNALLKTLEEPPEHVKFIFCTTDPEKIPITILSRCQRYDFPPVESKSIVGRLKHICEQEGIGADDDALQLLARRANGSMRDSQSLLEQLLSACPTKVSVQDVHTMLGTADGGQLSALALRLIDRDAAAALRELNAALESGVDAGQLAEQLLGYFRDMLAASVGCDADLLLHTPVSDHAALQEIGQRAGTETLLATMQILDQAVTRMRHSTHVRTLLELALIRISHLEHLDELSDLVSQLRQGTPMTGGSAPPPKSTPQKKNESPVASSPRRESRPASRAGDATVQESAERSPAREDDEPDDRAVAPAGSKREWTAEELWSRALAELSDMTGDYARSACSVRWGGPLQLVATFRAAYTHHKESLDRADRRTKVEAALAAVAGCHVRFETEVVPDAPVADSRPNTAASTRQRMQERQRHPLVRHAVEMFDGEVTRMDEPRNPSA